MLSKISGGYSWVVNLYKVNRNCFVLFKILNGKIKFDVIYLLLWLG